MTPSGWRNMLAQSSTKAAKTAATHYLRFNIQWSSIALLWYDYTLTFGSEVKYIWGGNFRISTALYVFCRYALVANILYLLAMSEKLGDSCDAWYKVISSLALFGRLAVIVTFTGRTYAICNGNRYILAYLSALGLACMILAIMHVPGVNCTGSSDKPIINSLLGTLMCIFEFSSALITLGYCLRALRVLRGTNVRARQFFMLLLEQGVVYFAFTALFTVATVVLNYRATPGTFLQRLLNALVLPLSCILTARFLIHLRRVEAKLDEDRISGSGTLKDQETTRLGTLRFNATQVSSIAADLGVDANVRNQMSRHVSVVSPSSSNA